MPSRDSAPANYINHIALVIDESYSMQPHARDLVRVADGQVKHLARRSQELDQETRVSIYLFSDVVRCVIYDKDVLRLPSLKGLYRPNGRTALLDATIKSQEDLAKTPELYGEHSFLTFVLTDGQENASRNRASNLGRVLDHLPHHWTVAVLVPDQLSKHEAKRFGFPADNIAIWDPSSTAGLESAGETIRRATDQFMEGRQSGIRGSRSIFSTGADAVNSQTVHSALVPLQPRTYDLVPVHSAAPIREYVYSRGLDYVIGKAFYQLTKTESIQPQKDVCVLEKATRKVYTGPQARDLVGLPQMEVRVKPQDNPEYDVFIQSTSVNRKLVPGTQLLLLR